VQLKEVLSKWKEEQLARDLIYQHLKTVAPSLADEFRDRHWCSLETAPKHLMGEILKKLLSIASKREIINVEDESEGEQEEESKRKNKTFTTDEQLVRVLIHEHLKTVAPSLAVEFQNTHCCSLETAPKHLLGELQKKVLAIAEMTEINKLNKNRGEQEQNNDRKRLSVKMNTFTSEELVRIKKAMANDEDIATVAKEMGRTYNSVRLKIYYLRKSAGLKKGRFSVQEIARMKEAVDNNEDYKGVAAELGRTSKSVETRMCNIKGNQRTQRKESYTIQEDLCILDKVINRLKVQKLSSAGFLSHSVLLELGKELQRNIDSLRQRWEGYLQPRLLQHYAGTTGFKIERILTSLVAEKFNDHRGIDWSELVNRHKEFLGHTTTSIRVTYHKVLTHAKAKKSGVSLQDVADYAAASYQPGKERKESAAKRAHREKIVLYFKERVAELGINVVV